MGLNAWVNHIMYRRFDRQRFDWVKWFAWKPVTLIGGERIWLKTIYRRGSKIRILGSGLSLGYDYGTIFDVIKGD